MATLHLNGRSIEVAAAPDTPLLWVIRVDAGLTGTKYGCGVEICKACSMWLDESSEKTCLLQVKEVLAKKIVTIEGLSADRSHPVQKAWAALDVPQCGYCQSGQIMSAAALLAKTPKPDRKQIVEHMNGNICRCGAYSNIVEAMTEVTGRPA